MPDRVVVPVGTKRGLFVLESNARRERWKLLGPFLKGWSIYHAVVDTRGTPAIHVAACSDFMGCTTFRGDLRGQSFRGAKRPPIPPQLLPGQLKMFKQYGISSSSRIWHIEPGLPGERRTLYAGTAPAALFRTDDDGKSWHPVEGLLRHPSRKTWTPGAGGMCLHSIQLDPTDSGRMVVGISSAGAFRTGDSGRTWTRINQSIPTLEGKPADPEAGT